MKKATDETKSFFDQFPKAVQPQFILAKSYYEATRGQGLTEDDAKSLF